MELSRAQEELILVDLNQPDQIEAFRALFSGPGYEQWIDLEDAPMDTSAMELRRLALEFFKRRFEVLRQQLYFGSGPKLSWLVEPSDFYFYSGLGVEPVLGATSEPDRRVAAFKVFQTVFDYSHRERLWSSRPWLGRADDPLLKLPYIRKYCLRRIELAERLESEQWEALVRAKDVLELFLARVEAVEIDRTGGEFQLPDIDDVQGELNGDGLGLDYDIIAASFGTISFELLKLERDYDQTPWGWKPTYPAIAKGRYEGIFSGQRRVISAATEKRMVIEALDALIDAVDALIHPLSDSERVELDAEREDLTEAARPTTQAPHGEPEYS